MVAINGQNIHYKSQNGCQISIKSQYVTKCNNNWKKKTLGEKKEEKNPDQSSTVCQALKKAARQILSQNHKNIV